jgi:hypothetical protein
VRLLRRFIAMIFVMVAAAADGTQASPTNDIKDADVARPALPAPSFHTSMLRFPTESAVLLGGLDVMMTLAQ